MRGSQNVEKNCFFFFLFISENEKQSINIERMDGLNLLEITLRKINKMIRKFQKLISPTCNRVSQLSSDVNSPCNSHFSQRERKENPQEWQKFQNP